MNYNYKIRFNQGKNDAKRYNRLWNISFEEYKNLLIKGCHYCGKALNNITGTSLDRIDNSKGYELNNVLPCCGPCNRIRNKYLTVTEMKIAMEAVLKYRRDINV